AAQKGQPADADELMDDRIAGDDDIVFEETVAGEHRAVGEDAAVADDAIVGDVGADHDEVIVAKQCLERAGGAAMDGGVFADDVVVADLDRGAFTLVFEVLRGVADDGAGVNDVSLAHGDRAKEVGARTDDAVVAQDDVAFEISKSTDFAVFADDGFGRND